ncbi:antigen identified by monoclonal antibody Ki-67 [Mortierella claussenii]|nr:antigen identified by monoclonal antibody Ki-67 [Mortierella claussenii]
MTETPKKRLLRKSSLQASPFSAPIKLFHSPAPSTSTAPSTPVSQRQQSLPFPQSKVAPMANPFLASESSTASATATDTHGQGSPSRKSARLSALHQKSILENNNDHHHNSNSSSSNSSSRGLNTPWKLVPPTTPKAKTILKTGIWGHVVGLKKQDESVYYRFPIDKSYCSFGRSDTNDIRVQIDAVSDLHCKLIRRDDGEVWLKDTSLNGTLLNNVLVHDTARPIQHNDVMTIAGRKFRFEATTPFSFTSSSTVSVSTPGRQINVIQKTIDDDLQILAEVPSPTAGRTLGTPKKNYPRSAAALESSLGLFTPNRAAKLSSLLVSPKPVPMPAFLAKSPKKTATPKKFIMIDEPAVANLTGDTVQDPVIVIEPGLRTPTRDKRRIPADFEDDSVGRTPKKVSFGPALSPEIFDKSNPPSTPVKRGQQQGPETPRRHGISTPSLLSKLSAVKPSSRPILTPSRSGGNVVNIIELQKPAPLNFFAMEKLNDDSPSDLLESTDQLENPVAQAEAEALEQESEDQDRQLLTALGEYADITNSTCPQHVGRETVQETSTEEATPAGDSESGSGSEDDLWSKLVPTVGKADAAHSLTEEEEKELHIPGLDELLQDIADEDVDEDIDDDGQPSSPTKMPMGWVPSPLISTPTRPRQTLPNVFQQERSHHAIKPQLSPTAPNNDHLPMSLDVPEDDSTPSYSPTIPDSNTPSADNTPKVVLANEEAEAVEQSDSSSSKRSFADVSFFDIPDASAASSELKRRASAPSFVDRSRSPIFSGLRGVFRTPQKVVESCFAGFAGFRNYVMTPTKSVIQQPLWPIAPTVDTTLETANEKDESRQEVASVETLEGHDSVQSIREEDTIPSSPYQSPTKPLMTSASSTTTPRRRVASHQDIMSILMGSAKEPSLEPESSSAVKKHSTLMSPAKSLDQIRAQGRKSDVFPQKRTISGRGHAHSVEKGEEDAGGAKEEKKEKVARDSSNVTLRRRTISLMEFKVESSKLTMSTPTKPDTTATTTIAAAAATEGTLQEVSVTVAGDEDQEDAEQETLLRLLYEGSRPDEEEDDEDAQEEGEQEGEDMVPIDEEEDKENIDFDTIADSNVEPQLQDSDDSGLDKLKEKERTPSRRVSDVYKSRESTPVKRRQSFKARLGSTSPAFRRYEQQQGSEDEDEVDEDEVAMMITPKRVRMRSFLGDC